MTPAETSPAGAPTAGAHRAAISFTNAIPRSARCCPILTVALLAGLLLPAGCVAAVRAPRERDVWYEYVADGQRYGYERTTVARLPDGNYEYKTESKVLIDVLGSGEQEFTSRATYVVTPDYRPVRFEAEGVQTVGATSARGHVADGKLEVEFSRAGVQGRVTIDLTRDALFAVSLSDWLHARPNAVSKPADAAAKPVPVTVINEERWQLMPGSFTPLRHDEAGSEWSFDLGLDAGQGTQVCDAEGVPLETRMKAPRMHSRRCDPGDAKQITCRVLTGRDVLMFPIDKDIGNPDRLTALSVRLTWNDIPFEEFKLEDARQRVVSHSVDDNRHAAIVRIAAPPPVTTRALHPIESREFAEFLGEDTYIRPRDPRVVAAAAEAVAGKQTALEAVEALSAYVFKYIDGGMIAETLAAPEILECRRGKCSEYAILFASLARARGIPTRIVLGDRIAAGQWIGHMWNEAYVGEWVPVDASANEVGASMALLKFIHSDTVSGTQPLRWALTESLDLSVVDFEQRPAPSAAVSTGMETGAAGNLYTNVDYNCRFATPANTWTVEEDAKPGVVTVRFRFPGDAGALLHLVAFAVPAGLEPTSLVAPRLQRFRAYDDFTVLRDEDYPIAGLTGRTLHFSRTEAVPESDSRRRMLTTEVVWTRGSSAYLVNLIAEESRHNELLPQFYALVNSFQPLEPGE